MTQLVNIVSLACVGYIDYVSYKIPNVILGVWAAASILNFVLISAIPPHDTLLKTSLASLLVTGSFIPISHIVKCNAGDFKLFGVLTVSNGFNDTLWIIFITLSFSIIPFAGGVKKVPIGFLTFFGYIAFLFFRKEGIL